jgi:hypothetical protein
MKIKFHGLFEELDAMLDRSEIIGTWEEKPNGVHMLRRAEGANLFWASGSGNMWVDHNAHDSANLLLRIKMAKLQERWRQAPPRDCDEERHYEDFEIEDGEFE